MPHSFESFVEHFISICAHADFQDFTTLVAIMIFVVWFTGSVFGK